MYECNNALKIQGKYFYQRKKSQHGWARGSWICDEFFWVFFGIIKHRKYEFKSYVGFFFSLKIFKEKIWFTSLLSAGRQKGDNKVCIAVHCRHSCPTVMNTQLDRTEYEPELLNCNSFQKAWWIQVHRSSLMFLSHHPGFASFWLPLRERKITPSALSSSLGIHLMHSQSDWWHESREQNCCRKVGWSRCTGNELVGPLMGAEISPRTTTNTSD